MKRHRVPIALLTFAAVILAGLLLMPPGGWPAHAGQVVAQAPADLSYTVAVGTCSSSSAQLVASSTAPREAAIIVPTSADTGIYIATGATVASSSTPLIGPGQAIVLSGRQAINCKRAGSADVTPGVFSGVAGGWVP